MGRGNINQCDSNIDNSRYQDRIKNNQSSWHKQKINNKMGDLNPNKRDYIKYK